MFTSDNFDQLVGAAPDVIYDNSNQHGNKYVARVLFTASGGHGNSQ